MKPDETQEQKERRQKRNKDKAWRRKSRKKTGWPK